MLTTAHKDLFKMIRGWGGKTLPVTLKKWSDVRLGSPNGVAPCPFDSWCGINYEKKTMLYVPARLPNIGVFIHETGHIFACKETPYRSNEFFFFGWEYIVAKRLGVVPEWEKSTAAYGINHTDDLTGLHYDEYGDLLNEPGAKARFLKKRLLEANERGLIVNGVPVSIR